MENIVLCADAWLTWIRTGCCLIVIRQNCCEHVQTYRSLVLDWHIGFMPEKQARYSLVVAEQANVRKTQNCRWRSSGASGWLLGIGRSPRLGDQMSSFEIQLALKKLSEQLLYNSHLLINLSLIDFKVGRTKNTHTIHIKDSYLFLPCNPYIFWNKLPSSCIIHLNILFLFILNKF